MIPRIIHQIWFGDKMPEEFRFYTATWLHHHSDWVYQLWNEDNIFELRNADAFERAEEIAPHNVGQLRADIVRYEILHKLGGVYVDMDFECVKPLDLLIKDASAFAAWEVQGKWINNAILGCEAGDGFINAIIEEIPRNIQRFVGARPNKLTGPQLLTRLYKWIGPDLTVFDKELFYPYLYTELHKKGQTFPNAYAIHHWNNARRKAIA